MLTHILVPLDGSTTAEGVIPHARAFAQAFKARVTLTHVLDPTPLNDDALMQIAPMSWSIRKSGMRAYLDAIAASMKLEGLDADVVLLEGRVVESIAEYARMQGVDLLMLSSHGHGVCEELALGSTAHCLLLRCSAHKLIVHTSAGNQAAPAPGAQRYQRLLMPLDGSWRAECALPLAYALAERMGAAITYAHAVRKPEMARRIPLSEEEAKLGEQVARRNREDVEAYFQQLCMRGGVVSDTEFVNGSNAGLALQTLAGRLQPDLIVLTAHGFSGAMQLPFGNVASYFVTNGAVPVLIVQDDIHDRPEHAPAAATALRQQEAPQHA